MFLQNTLRKFCRFSETNLRTSRPRAVHLVVLARVCNTLICRYNVETRAPIAELGIPKYKVIRDAILQMEGYFKNKVLKQLTRKRYLKPSAPQRPLRPRFEDPHDFTPEGWIADLPWPHALACSILCRIGFVPSSACHLQQNYLGTHTHNAHTPATGPARYIPLHTHTPFLSGASQGVHWFRRRPP